MTLNIPIMLNFEIPIITLSPQSTFTLGANGAVSIAFNDNKKSKSDDSILKEKGGP